MLNSWTAKDGGKRSKIYCKADIVTFMNGESSKPKPQPQEDLTKEDEELQSIPF